jgi:hypothetical protein
MTILTQLEAPVVDIPFMTPQPFRDPRSLPSPPAQFQPQYGPAPFQAWHPQPQPCPPPPAKSYALIIGVFVALPVGAPLLAFGARAAGAALQPNYLEETNDVPRLIEKKVGCAPCAVSYLTVTKDTVIASMPEANAEHSRVWDISRLGAFPRDGWEPISRDPEDMFNPRDIDWSELPSQAKDWQAKTGRRSPPYLVTVRRCFDDKSKLCFDFH